MIDSKFDDFLKNWGAEKAKLSSTMKDNRKWNEQFRVAKNLTTDDRLYKKGKKSVQIGKNKTASVLLNEIPEDILLKTSLLDEEYKIEASVGQGEISEIPWLCIFDKQITKSAQTGFYIVYLFRADLSGFYLSLNQGWTQYKTAFKPVTLARAEIAKNAGKIKRTLKTVDGFSFNDIDLKGRSDLARGYELGNICSKYYDSSSLPNSNTLVNDLQKLIGTYRELKSLVGNNILDIDLVLSEEEFQERIQLGVSRVPKKGKVSKKRKINSSNSSTWWRDPDMSFTAISDADFKCENNPNHKTFVSAVTSEQFVEAHHLIPMEFQDNFDASIDVPENIISLCPNCHRAFHNSVNEIKRDLIIQFFNKRKTFLQDRQINVSENKLLEYYKIKTCG
jgi:5-methylcytosine-specific restriction protein A